MRTNMAINVYECGRGGKYVNMFRYPYAGIREMKMQMEKEDRHIDRKKPPPPRGFSYLLCSLIKNRV